MKYYVHSSLLLSDHLCTDGNYGYYADSFEFVVYPVDRFSLIHFCEFHFTIFLILYTKGLDYMYIIY